MSAVAEAAADLAAALATVPDPIDAPAHLRVYTDTGASVDPPCVVVGPPLLRWEAGCTGPTSARFPVAVIVPADERALERLWDLTVQVGDVLDGVTDAVVLEAAPSSWPSGTGDLPSYQFSTEVSL